MILSYMLLQVQFFQLYTKLERHVVTIVTRIRFPSADSNRFLNTRTSLFRTFPHGKIVVGEGAC